MARRVPVYIAGPYTADTAEGRERNVARAAQLSRYAVQCVYAPIIPHPAILAGGYGDDAIEAEREAGLEAVFDCWFQCGPSVGWSPTTYETVFLPLVREAVDLTHEHDAIYIYQDDGRMRDVMRFIQQEHAARL